MEDLPVDNVCHDALEEARQVLEGLSIYLMRVNASRLNTPVRPLVGIAADLSVIADEIQTIQKNPMPSRPALSLVQ